MMLKMKKINGQSTLEYLLVLGAIVAVVLYAASHWIGGTTGSVKDYLDDANSAIGSAADKLP
jgi:uncharacterized protein (UPF0333 family)